MRWSNRACMAAITAALMSSGTDAHAADDVRRSVFSLSAQEIEQYRNVVRAMKALPADDPRNWEYQSGIHQYITPQQVDDLPETMFSASDKAEMRRYALTPPSHALTNGTWNQCHKTTPDLLFLLWHRVYVYYFEKIAQKVSNQHSFRLPYWDYTKGDSLSRALPAAFREDTYVPTGSAQPIPNPLKVVRRASINSGRPLDSSLVSLDALKENTLEGFGLALENRPHNVIHGALGKENTLLMGFAVFAAQDPIFWLHHSNVDRLWTCWERSGNTSSSLGDDGQKYPFIDEDGKVVRHSIPEMEALAASMSYQYESLGDCLQKPAADTVPFALLESSTVNAFKSSAPLVLDQSPTVVKIAHSEAASKALSNKALVALKAPSSAVLTLSDITVSAPLSLVYKVNIRRRGSDDMGMTIGVIGFFGKGETAFARGMGESHANHTTRPFDLRFKAGSEVMSLLASDAGASLELVFVPSTGVEGDSVSGAAAAAAIGGARPTIGGVSLDIKLPSGLLLE